MLRLTRDRKQRRTTNEVLSRFSGGERWQLWFFLLGGTLLLSGCGSSSLTTPGLLPVNAGLSGNWQFTLANPSDQSFVGGIQGGFLVEDDQSGSVTGSVTFSIAIPQASPAPAVICNSGSAAITGTVNDKDVTLTATAGAQTFTFAGALSLDNSTLVGTYSSTTGTASDGSECGTAQSGLPWTATFVPALSGLVQGSFHSTGGLAGLSNQNFPVIGRLDQGPNSGATSASVTGTLNFLDPTTNAVDYPCAGSATVSGQISGNAVILQLVGSDGSSLGQIGGIAAGQSVTFDRTVGGNVVHDLMGIGYVLNSKVCPGTSLANAGDSGNICLGVNSTACTQPITLTPGAVTFSVQALGTSKTQTITLTNTTASTLNGLAFTLTNHPADAANFSVVGDTCDIPGSAVGSPFFLLPGLSCNIPVAFTPQQSASVSATLNVTSPLSVDNDTAFAVPIKGIGKADQDVSERVVEDK